jgi:hypothetical protein
VLRLLRFAQIIPVCGEHDEAEVVGDPLGEADGPQEVHAPAAGMHKGDDRQESGSARGDVQGPSAQPDAREADNMLVTDPTDAAVLADWRWLHQQLQRNGLPQLRGRHVAVLAGEIIGAGDDPQTLRERLAQERQICGDRLVIAYVE